MSWLIATILKWLGSDVLNSVLGYLKARADNETERQKIQAAAQTTIITTGMSFKWFWIPWLMATVPLAGWFGYGMVNTIFPSLPHEAIIPPGLLHWAEIAWSNLFYSGAGVASTSIISNALASWRR